MNISSQVVKRVVIRFAQEELSYALQYCTSNKLDIIEMNVAKDGRSGKLTGGIEIIAIGELPEKE
jgi:hypothetical protein